MGNILVNGSVVFNRVMNLDEPDKARARDNIGIDDAIDDAFDGIDGGSPNTVYDTISIDGGSP